MPGAYPTTMIKNSASSDFTRTIQLTSDKPSQAIGRSSRNEAKGLFAAPTNGFFESPVMSRTHAEVRMVLEPHRKVCAALNHFLFLFLVSVSFFLFFFFFF